MLEEHYPKAVLTQVNDELECIDHLNSLIKKFASEGKLDQAKRLAKEINNSLDQLKIYNESKQHSATAMNIYITQNIQSNKVSARKLTEQMKEQIKKDMEFGL